MEAPAKFNHMDNKKLKDDFLRPMIFASICCHVFFGIVRRTGGNKFLLVLSFLLLASVILILLEFGIRKYTQKEFKSTFNPFLYFLILIINIIQAALIVDFYFIVQK